MARSIADVADVDHRTLRVQLAEAGDEAVDVGEVAGALAFAGVAEFGHELVQHRRAAGIQADRQAGATICARVQAQPQLLAPRDAQGPVVCVRHVGDGPGHASPIPGAEARHSSQMSAGGRQVRAPRRRRCHGQRRTTDETYACRKATDPRRQL